MARSRSKKIEEKKIQGKSEFLRISVYITQLVLMFLHFNNIDERNDI